MTAIELTGLPEHLEIDADILQRLEQAANNESSAGGVAAQASALD